MLWSDSNVSLSHTHAGSYTYTHTQEGHAPKFSVQLLGTVFYVRAYVYICVLCYIDVCSVNYEAQRRNMNRNKYIALIYITCPFVLCGRL